MCLFSDELAKPGQCRELSGWLADIPDWTLGKTLNLDGLSVIHLATDVMVEVNPKSIHLFLLLRSEDRSSEGKFGQRKTEGNLGGREGGRAASVVNKSMGPESSIWRSTCVYTAK